MSCAEGFQRPASQVALMDKFPKELTARNCRALLLDLAGRDILVKLLLHSGQSLQGRVLVVGSERQTETLVLAHDREDNVSFLDLAAVCAVTMSVNPNSLPVLTAGKVKHPAELEPLSRLAFKRRLADLDAWLLSELGRPLPLRSEPSLEELREGLAPLLFSIESLVEVLLSLRQDELGREALARVSEVRLATSSQARVDLLGQALHAGLPGRMFPDDWRPLVEAAL